MALEVKLGQDLRLRQQLVMTPQLQQAIKILQLSLPELEAVIQTEVERNPLLEPLDDRTPGEVATGESPEVAVPGESPGLGEGELLAGPEAAPEGAETEGWEGDQRISEPPAAITAPTPTETRDAAVAIKEDGLDKVDWREYFENYANNWQDAGAADSGDEDEDRRRRIEHTLTRRVSLEEHLLWQLRLSAISQGDQPIAAAIIYNLNDNAYLETPLEELAAQLEVPLERIERVLSQVQKFDPPGVAARDLKECLYLQLRTLGMEESLATRIVLNHLGLLEKHRHAEIARLSGVTPEQVREAAKVISLLEPKPGRYYDGRQPIYIVPDVFIQKVGADFVVTLNEDAVPKLRLAGYCQRVLRDEGLAAETKEYLQERLRSARWLVKSIYQRQQTIFKVARSIVKFQRAFFEHGISHLRPLVLKNVADDIGMHESTISRATANKYAHTPQGLFELKFFFTSGVKGAGSEEVSAETVKEKIRALVAAEKSGEPLSDQMIAAILVRENINIARRTVAKYRQALGILASARRKQPG